MGLRPRLRQAGRGRELCTRQPRGTSAQAPESTAGGGLGLGDGGDGAPRTPPNSCLCITHPPLIAQSRSRCPCCALALTGAVSAAAKAPGPRGSAHRARPSPPLPAPLQALANGPPHLSLSAPPLPASSPPLVSRRPMAPPRSSRPAPGTPRRVGSGRCRRGCVEGSGSQTREMSPYHDEGARRRLEEAAQTLPGGFRVWAESGPLGDQDPWVSNKGRCVGAEITSEHWGGRFQLKPEHCHLFYSRGTGVWSCCLIGRGLSELHRVLEIGSDGEEERNFSFSRCRLKEDLPAPRPFGSSETSVLLGYGGGGGGVGGGEEADGNTCSFCFVSPSLVLTSGPPLPYSQKKSFWCYSICGS